LKNHKQFGNMRLGSLVDCLSLKGHEAAVASLAADYLRQRGVDLIVSNQLHPDWGAGLRAAGLITGPSNFGLALSPPLARLAGCEADALPRWHFNRGDGDGPINL
jgi:hypothetical protein